MPNSNVRSHICAHQNTGIQTRSRTVSHVHTWAYTHTYIPINMARVKLKDNSQTRSGIFALKQNYAYSHKKTQSGQICASMHKGIWGGGIRTHMLTTTFTITSQTMPPKIQNKKKTRLVFCFHS